MDGKMPIRPKCMYDTLLCYRLSEIIGNISIILFYSWLRSYVAAKTPLKFEVERHIHN